MSEPQPNSNSVTDNVKKSDNPEGDPSITSSDLTTSATSSVSTTSSATTISQEPKVPISRNFLQLSKIELDKTGENKGRVLLSNKLVYFGPIEVIDDPVIYTVPKLNGETTPYSINVIKISDKGYTVKQG